LGGLFSGQLLTAVHLLWLHNPLSEFRHELDQVAPLSLPLWRRVYWAMCVNHSPRGFGWNYEVSNLPLRPAESGWVFIRSRLLKAVGFFLLVDLSQSYMHSNPLFSLAGNAVMPITSQGYILRCLNIAAWTTIPYGMLSMQYNLLASVAVAVGFSEPKYWAAPFGSLAEAYTVRRFWGRTWHQLLRRYAAGIGQFCSRCLGCSPKSTSGLLVQLYVGFMVSGLMHSAGGDAMVGMQYLWASMPFFIAQPVAITFETVIIGIARQAGYTRSNVWTYLLGYTWVFLWFGVSAPWFINWAVYAGLGHSEIFPISPIRSTVHILENITGIEVLPK